MENFRNKPFLGFKLCALLSSVMKSHPVLLCPARDANHPFVQHIPTVSHVLAVLVIRSDQLWRYHSACVQVTLILLNNGPKTQE